MRPLLLHKSCQTKAIVDFSDLTICMRISHTMDSRGEGLETAHVSHTLYGDLSVKLLIGC